MSFDAHKTSTIQPRSATDHTDAVTQTIKDRLAAWEAVLRMRVGNDRGGRTLARTALRGAAHVLASSVKADDHNNREFVVRALLARRRPAGLHPRHPWGRAVLAEAITDADRRLDDQGLRATVAVLASTSTPGATCSGRARRSLVDGAVRREAALRRGFDRLVTANMGLVRGDVKRYLAGRDAVLGLQACDLVQEGAIGLLRGLRTFDPSRGFALSTYVLPWVRQASRRAVADQGSVVRAPVGLVETMAKVNAARRSRPGEDLSVDDLAAMTGRTKGRVRTALERYPLTVSADAPISGPTAMGNASLAKSRAKSMSFGDGATFLDRLEDPSPWDFAEVLAQQQMATLARRAVDLLPPREAHVVRTRYLADGAGDGIGDEFDSLRTARDGLPTLESVGRTLGVSRERVRQIERKALAVVRRRMDAGENGRRFVVRPMPTHPAVQVDLFA
mgnify:CR=1 FL=1